MQGGIRVHLVMHYNLLAHVMRAEYVAVENRYWFVRAALQEASSVTNSASGAKRLIFDRVDYLDAKISPISSVRKSLADWMPGSKRSI